MPRRFALSPMAWGVCHDGVTSASPRTEPSAYRLTLSPSNLRSAVMLRSLRLVDLLSRLPTRHVEMKEPTWAFPVWHGLSERRARVGNAARGVWPPCRPENQGTTVGSDGIPNSGSANDGVHVREAVPCSGQATTQTQHADTAMIAESAHDTGKTHVDRRDRVSVALRAKPSMCLLPGLGPFADLILATWETGGVVFWRMTPLRMEVMGCGRSLDRSREDLPTSDGWRRGVWWLAHRGGQWLGAHRGDDSPSPST